MNRRVSRRTLLVACAAAMGTAALIGVPFRAHAVKQQPDAKSLRFDVYGDCRDGHDVHRKIVARIIADKPALVFQTGDLVHRGTDDSLWKIYDDITGEMRKKIPLYPVRGNHDFGGPGYDQRFTEPYASGTKNYYSLDRGNVHFIVLDVDEHEEFGPGTPQYKWLVSDLKAFKGKAQHIFVFFHVPPYSIGSHGMNPEVQEKLCPLFDEYGVRIVFCGHDHNYYRTTRKGIAYVVTGGGGAPLYDVNPDRGAIAGDKFEKVNHYCTVDVKGADVTVQAVRADGTLIEKFTVSSK